MDIDWQPLEGKLLVEENGREYTISGCVGMKIHNRETLHPFFVKQSSPLDALSESVGKIKSIIATVPGIPTEVYTGQDLLGEKCWRRSNERYGIRRIVTPGPSVYAHITVEYFAHWSREIQ